MLPPSVTLRSPLGWACPAVQESGASICGPGGPAGRGDRDRATAEGLHQTED